MYQKRKREIVYLSYKIFVSIIILKRNVTLPLRINLSGKTTRGVVGRILFDSEIKNIMYIINKQYRLVLKVYNPVFWSRHQTTRTFRFTIIWQLFSFSN